MNKAILTVGERNRLYADWAAEKGDVFNLLQRVSLGQYYKMIKLGYRKIEGDAVLIGTLESLKDSLDADKDLAYIKALGSMIKWYKEEK